MAVRLALDDVHAGYEPGVAVVDGLDLTVKESERLALLGPSGCGKTTTLRLIAGLLAPTSGDILFDDESVLSIRAERRGAVMVFQRHALFPFRTVAENVAFGLKLRKVPASERTDRVRRALDDVLLAGFEGRYPDELSGGQQQRVALARALAVEPRVLLLDEPLSSLDPALRDDLSALIRRVQRAHDITTVMVTHDQRDAMSFGDRVAVMIDGRLRQIGSPQDFHDRPVDLEVAQFFGSDNPLAGFKRGPYVETAIGRLTTTDIATPDGPVFVTIRPDVIETRPDIAEHETASTNCFRATVEGARYVGIAFDCEARIGDTPVRFLVPSSAEQPLPGATTELHFPERHVRVLPVATSETSPIPDEST